VDPGLSLDYVTTVLAALLVGTGFVLQQHAAAMLSASRFLSIRLIIDLFRKPRWLAGIGLLVGGYILAAWSIGHLELSLAEPLLTTYLIFALVLAVPLSGHAFRLREVTGAVILVTGVALLSASRSAKPIGLSFGSVSHWPAAAGIAAIAVILVEAGRRRPGRLRAALTGTAAGLVLGIQDALTRQTLQALQGNPVTVLFSTWPAYALAGAGALGIWLTQNAFSAGPLQASLPAISAGEPLIGILLGVIVFGDRIQISPGLLAIQAGGVAALVAGVVLVASDPALSQLREQASKLRSAVRDTAPHSAVRSQPGRSGADAAVGGSPGDAISSGASPEGAPGNPAQGVVPGGLPDGDMQGGTARGGVNSRTAPGGVNSSAMRGAANSSTALDGAKEGPIPGQQVAGDRGGAEMIAD
jgi:drug/metabolite transporter (DMT)-like permease